MRIAYREWRVRWHATEDRPILQSTYMNTPWPEAILEADQLPEDDIRDEFGKSRLGKLHGVHAQLTQSTNVSFLSTPFVQGTRGMRLVCRGAVDLIGKVVEHEDGICRAEQVRVLALRLVDISHPPSPCAHNGPEALYAVTSVPAAYYMNKLRRVCLPQWVNGAQYPDDWSYHSEFGYYGRKGGCQNWDPKWMGDETSVLRGPLTVRAIEDMLLGHYQVPLLPDDAGPWLRDK